MMSWIRLDTEIDDSARFDDLDGIGRAVYLWVLRRAKKRRGSMSSRNWRPDFVARRTGFEDMADRVKTAMDQLTEPGGLLEVADGKVWVDGWASYQIDRTAADRQERYREARDEKPNDIAKTVTGCNGENRDSRKSRQRYPTVPIPTDTEQGERAPVDLDQEYEGEKNTDLQHIVAHLMEKWPEWNQMLVEPVAMRLYASHPDLSLKDWTEIIDQAYPKVPVDVRLDRVQTWIANEITFWKRDRARDKDRATKFQGPTPPPQTVKEFEPDPIISRTPEEQAEVDAARAKAMAAIKGCVASCTLPDAQEAPAHRKMGERPPVAEATPEQLAELEAMRARARAKAAQQPDDTKLEPVDWKAVL